MADRLPIDANVIGYWGFDEADDSDPATDESSNGLTLTFSGSPLAVPGRDGNAKQFDGSSVFASPTSSTLFQISGGWSVIVWANLFNVNSGGSLLRTIVACDGSTGAQADNTQFNVSVDSNGALVYKHEHGTAIPTIWKTANGVVKTNRYFSIALTRSVSAGVATVTLLLNNAVVPWASITDNSLPTASPPPPDGGTTATFKVGKSSKASDSAFWNGGIDELSIHNVARRTFPYFLAAFYRVSLVEVSRLSAYQNIRSVGSAEMGGGTRWWTWERDSSIFVVREGPLGYFSPEVQLATGGVTGLGAPVPASGTQPELIYDPVSDTLVVAFLAGGRIYKITANSGDAAATENMPYTADTSGIIKLHDSTESSRIGAGQAPFPVVKGLNGDGGQAGESTPAQAFIQFVPIPSFGIAVQNNNPYGFALYRTLGGGSQLIATLTSPFFTNGVSGTYYYFSISSRIFGAGYYAVPLRRNGSLGVNYTTTIYDFFGQVLPFPDVSNTTQLADGFYGDLIDIAQLGAGQPTSDSVFLVTFVNRTPLKISFADSDPENTVGAGASNSDIFTEITFVNRTPLKISFQDQDTATNTVGAGQADHLQVGGTGRPGVVL